MDNKIASFFDVTIINIICRNLIYIKKKKVHTTKIFAITNF